VFLLYAQDTYDRQTLEAVKNRIVDQMVNGRKFGRFGEFSDELQRVGSLKSDCNNLFQRFSLRRLFGARRDA
jgi:hypothetical protein